MAVRAVVAVRTAAPQGRRLVDWRQGLTRVSQAVRLPVTPRTVDGTIQAVAVVQVRLVKIPTPRSALVVTVAQARRK
jgi:hypothetical protein